MKLNMLCLQTMITEEQIFWCWVSHFHTWFNSCMAT